MTPFKEIVRLPEFERDMKTLIKRFRSLEDDLDNFIKTELTLFHKIGIDNKGIVQISGLGIQGPKVYKARKFACRALKGKGAHSGIRVVYAHFARWGSGLNNQQIGAPERRPLKSPAE